MHHLSLVFEVLLQNTLYLKYSKCQFGVSHIEYLGHVISAKGVSMDSEKIKCMVAWPYPTTVKEVRGFLGLTGYYRRFVSHYGLIAKPLIDLLKRNAFEWTVDTQTAWDALKQAMCTAPVLALPNFNILFVVEADACSNGIGAVLSQRGRPVAFLSKALSLKHQSLSVYDKEMLAILLAVKKMECIFSW